MNAVVEPPFVAPAVQVVERQFRIELGGRAYTQVFSSGREIPDNTRSQSVRETIAVEEDVLIESLWVAVSITHLSPPGLQVKLVSPTMGTLTLHEETRGRRDVVFVEHLRRVYTSRDKPLDQLVGTSAQGDWTLTVGDYAGPHVGTPDAWGIGFGTAGAVAGGRFDGGYGASGGGGYRIGCPDAGGRLDRIAHRFCRRWIFWVNKR